MHCNVRISDVCSLIGSFFCRFFYFFYDLVLFGSLNFILILIGDRIDFRLGFVISFVYRVRCFPRGFVFWNKLSLRDLVCHDSPQNSDAYSSFCPTDLLLTTVDYAHVAVDNNASPERNEPLIFWAP